GRRAGTFPRRARRPLHERARRARGRAAIVAIDGDPFPTDLEAARRYAPRFDLIVMPGVSHYPMPDAPNRFTRLLEDAIGRVVG
ncbi:MAG TPA: hypothetical protein VIM86_15485, partial [Thermodesulfobacteriota bacterium]